MATQIPLPYRLFFLYVEPVATAVGAYYAHFDQAAYLSMTDPSWSPGENLSGPSRVESIVLTQLANLYLVFALSEALVLRATSDRTVWRVFLLGLLLADLGHVCSVRALGPSVYWRFWDWNAMYWGNLGFVYVGATMRSCFLLDLGLTTSTSTVKSAKSPRKTR